MVKIGEAASKKLDRPDSGPTFKDVAKTMALIVAGKGLGDLAAETLVSKVKFFNTPTSERVKAMKVILPILGGAAFVLGEQLRKKREEAYRGKPK